MSKEKSERTQRTLGGLSSKLLEDPELEDDEQKENPNQISTDQGGNESEENIVADFVKNPRKEKRKQEETHQRKTFLVEKELLKWMRVEARRYGHGFYVDFVNASLRLGKQRYEEAKKRKSK